MDGPPALADLVAGGFPHLAGAEPGVLEAVDQRLDDLALPLRLAGAPKRPLDDRLDQAQPLDPLRGPVGRDGVGGHPPDLLGVGLEEDLEEDAAEAVDDPVLEAPLGPDRPQPRLDVARQDAGRAHRAELPEGVGRLERVVEELAVVVDAAQPRPGDELVAEDLAPDAVDLVALGEEAVAADVEPIALVLVGPADPADEVRVGLERRRTSGRARSARRPRSARPGPPPAITVACDATTAIVSGSSTFVQRCGGRATRSFSRRDDSVPIRASHPLEVTSVAGCPSGCADYSLFRPSAAAELWHISAERSRDRRPEGRARRLSP